MTFAAHAEIDKNVQFCSNCVVSNQRPTKFNEEGICYPCVWSYEKDFVINWNNRESVN